MSSIFRSKQIAEINFNFKIFTKFYICVPFLSQVHNNRYIFAYSTGSMQVTVKGYLIHIKNNDYP
jgi:hypothetical protein